jgi:hypothetical protein
LVFDSQVVGNVTGGAGTPSGSGLGIPFMYTFRQMTYEFYFYPNLNYSLVCNYIQDYTDLVQSTDNNDFTNLADRLIMYEALSHLYGENRQDQSMENSFFAKADREYENLKMRGFQMQESGELVVETIL